MTRGRFSEQDESGQIFGPFRLVRQIAVGGMAEIYLAKAKGIGGFEKHLALKMIHPNFSEDEHFVSMLIEEAKISVQLTHANIAQTFDLGKFNDTYYIAMEWIDGADLYKLLRRASERNIPVPIEVAAYVAQEVCAGLDYAHRKLDEMGRPLDIIHRDISPQNVLLSYAGEVKVVDFGIAKAAHRAAQTAAGVIKGKYYYMSPEQAWGETLDQRSDIFSTGIILYESLTGQMLYLEENILRLLDMVRKADIASPRVLRPDVPAPLERIVMKALARKADDRWQLAADFSAALSKFLYGFAPDFTAARLSAFMRRVLLDEEVTPPIRSQSSNKTELPSAMSRIDFSGDDEAAHSVIVDPNQLPQRPRSRRSAEDATAQLDSPLSRRGEPSGSEVFSLSGDSRDESDSIPDSGQVELPGGENLHERTGTVDLDSRAGELSEITGSNQVDEDETRLDAVDLPSMLAGRPLARKGPLPDPARKGAAPEPARKAAAAPPADVGRSPSDSTRAAVPSARISRGKPAAVEARGGARPGADVTPPLRPREEELAWDEDAPTRYHEHRGRDEAPAPAEPAPEPRSGRNRALNGGRPAPAGPSPAGPSAAPAPPPGLPPPRVDDPAGEPAREWWMPAPQAAPVAPPPRSLPWVWLAAGIAALVIGGVVLLVLLLRQDAPSSGSIEVSSDPKGALITHNGKQLSHRTPHRLVGLDLKAVHLVEVWLPTYERSRHSLGFAGGNPEQTVFARLRPETGRLVVDSIPPGAEVLINGQRQGLTPGQFENIPLSADARVEVKMSGHASQIRQVPWNNQREQKLSVELKPLKKR